MFNSVNSKRKIIAIIQARTGSTRLNNKIFLDLKGKSLLWHIINRIKNSKNIEDIIIATTVNKNDDEIMKFAMQNNMKYFRGSEENVLDRFYQTAKKYKIDDIIIRITADDPFKDPRVIDKAVCIFLRENYDYVSNTIKPTYPEGIDIEVFSFSALEKAWEEADGKSDKEHVTSYIWKNPNKFKTYNFEYKEDLSYLRWTIDYEEDYLFVKEIYENLYMEGKIFYMEDILTLLNKEPKLNKINQNVIRREGYQKIFMEEGSSGKD